MSVLLASCRSCGWVAFVDASAGPDGAAWRAAVELDHLRYDCPARPQGATA